MQTGYRDTGCYEAPPALFCRQLDVDRFPGAAWMPPPQEGLAFQQQLDRHVGENMRMQCYRYHCIDSLLATTVSHYDQTTSLTKKTGGRWEARHVRRGARAHTPWAHSMHNEIGQLGRAGKHSALALESNPIVFAAQPSGMRQKNAEPANQVDELGNGRRNQNASQSAWIWNH